MKLIVDAQLPRRLARWLAARGHDALHTLDLEEGNRTPDVDIARLALRENRILVTKDSDFVSSHLVNQQPPKLLLVTTGNMGNADLERLVERNLNAIESALESSAFVELGRNSLVIHD